MLEPTSPWLHASHKLVGASGAAAPPRARSGQPWSHSAEAHLKALEGLTEAGILSNLRATQTTLLFLVAARYRYYRRSVEWTRRLILFQLVASARAVATMIS